MKLYGQFHRCVYVSPLLAGSATALGLLLIHAGSATAETSQVPPAWAAPPIDQASSIRDATSGATIDLTDLLEKLAAADAVFLGESHTDETTHRLQLEIYRGLLSKKQNDVVLALEMFERDVQTVLERYLTGELSEAEFLKLARPWSNYQEAYRPLIKEAKKASESVVASNFPTELVRKLAIGGPEALESLTERDRRHVPRQYLPNTAEYWKRVDNAVRGHQGMMDAPESPEERLYSAQSLWDNAMGEACADAIDQHPGYLVLHINGGFHSAYHDGAVRQLRLRKPQATILTVAIVPTLNPSTEELRGRTIADYVAFVEARATNVDQGKRSVQVGRELKYLLHLPSATRADAPWPLLIWLPQRGLSAEEELAYRVAQFGEDAAIAVVEPPYRETGWDLSVGGRWYWEDTFAEDVSTAAAGIEEIWAYLLRHFPLGAERVCVAGEGAGATMAAVVATQSERMDHIAVAIDPAEYASLKDLPLLLPETFGDEEPPSKFLKVLADESQRQWWRNELEQYEGAGVTSNFQAAATDPWEHDRQRENAICAALGLDKRPASPEGKRSFIIPESDSPRARHWARLQALWHRQSTQSPTVALHEPPVTAAASLAPINITPSSVSEEGVLPRCPGPFGGTTVLVLPVQLPPDEAAAWMALEATDPLAAASRFHRLRVATASGDRALAGVLKKLLSENRKNVLIVPACFYAEPAWMQSLYDSVTELQDEMTIHWLPGLGGRRGLLPR